MNTFTYPQSPESVPPNLTEPSSAYKTRAWMAMGGLSLFIGLYVGLTAWFAWTAWRMFSSFRQGAEFEFSGALAGAAAAFMFVFMVKALFAVKHSGELRDVEVKADAHPRLFEFLYRLADEAGAPRPHKVYLSNQVNAAVFYDLSLLNLFFPSRKNLLIGLGLVNVLNLGEFKAVLAHEFGHFAQRSMAVGRWVYIAQQIAAHIVAKRDALDRFLAGLCRVDIRVAWIGWILQLIVWSIRALLDTVFRLVIMSERALSRQMEFQADLVAVSLTGSDALVHALNKLNAGDEAWNRTVAFVNREIGNKRKVPDIYAVQTAILEKLRRIYCDDGFGRVPPVPGEAPESHRVFTSSVASPPQMWSTHPENSAREENSKQSYVACPIDARQAWEVFSDPEKLRRDMSAHLVESVEADLGDISVEESLQHLDEQYAKNWLMPRYRGVYLGRSVVRSAPDVADLYLPDVPTPSAADFDALYPEGLQTRLEKLRELHEERQMLQGLRDKVMKTAGGVIQFRGETIKRRHLPRAIADVKGEIEKLEAEIADHDRQVRSLHLRAAREIGKGWPEYLQGVAALLHFAEHSGAEINDVNRYVANVWSVITADGRISEKEAKRLMQSVADAHSAMQSIFAKGRELQLSGHLQDKLGFDSIQAAVGEYNLPAPQRDNINDWMKVFDSWIGVFSFALSRIAAVALEELLSAEEKVATAYREGEILEDAPRPPVVPSGYRTLVPGHERELQKKLDWWDSFFTATGLLPALARAFVAISIVGAVLWWGQSLGNIEVSIYNGLARTVEVELNGKDIRVGPHGRQTIALSPASRILVATRTEGGELIEEFSQPLEAAGFQHHVYNVAAAAPVVKWWAVYGDATQPSNLYLGAERWLNTPADYYFQEPPEEIRTEDEGGTRSVLGAYGELPPARQFELVGNAEETAALIRAHARWDDVGSTYYLVWLAYLSRLPEAWTVVRERLEREPEAIALLRTEQQLATGSELEGVCQRHTAMAASKPESSGLNYLAARCMPQGPEKMAALEQGRKTWPDDEWFANALGHEYSLLGDWQQALAHYQAAMDASLPLKFRLGDYVFRLHRAIGGDSDLDVRELAEMSERVYWSLATENGTDYLDSPSFAYHYLYKGELAQALQLASADDGTYANVLILAAASSGAQRNWIDEALATNFEFGSNESAAWAMWALALREGRDARPYEESLLALGREYTQQVFDFVAGVRASRGSRNFSAAEAGLTGLPAIARGYALSSAAILTGGRIPESWIREANGLLYADERPYLAGL